MQGFWWKLPVLRGLSPVRRGFAEAMAVALAAAAIFGFTLGLCTSSPTVGVLQTLAEVDATLLVASVFVTSMIARAARHRSFDERESRLGSFVGVGAAGLIGIVLALVLSERVAAHHWTWIDDLGLGWLAGSVLLLGALVVMQPLITYEWMVKEPNRADDDA